VDVGGRSTGRHILTSDLGFKYGIGVHYSDFAENRPIVSLEVTFRIPQSRISLPKKDRETESATSNSSIELATITYRINERYLVQLFFRDWKSGDFGAAFPELNPESSEIATLEIDDAVHRIESQAASAERNLSLLGFSIPLAQLSRWGALGLLSVQLYFWLHLHELVNRIEPNAEGWNVA
jgi:hypothetical protein